MSLYLVCETFSNTEIISWDSVNYTLGTDAFNDIVTAELVASQDSPDPENEIIVFAGEYTSSLNNFQNYEGITLNVTGVKYHDDDADKATVTLKNFKNNGIATFANAAFEATSVINNAGKTITLNGATFTATTVTNDGTFTIKGGATVNSTFTSTSIEKPGTIRLAGTINSNSEILGDNTISIASATTLDGATVVGGILDVKNHLTLKAATLTADTANITSGKYIIVDAGTSIINLDEVNFTGSTGITMKEGAILTGSNIAGTVSVHTSATGDGATITGENTIEAILVPNKATAVKLNLLEANLTSDITVNGNGIVNALGDNVVTGDITNNGVINVADGNSLELNDGGLANAGTINLTGSITTTTTAQIANSGNIIVTGTGDLAAAVVMGDNGKVVFGTVDAAAETTFNGSITDIYNNPNPAIYGKSTVQVLNGEVEFAAGSVVDIQGDAADNRFTVGFRDAAIDPATVAATATVKGTVASHNGTWIGAAGAYDESFFDKKFVLIVDGGSYTNDANAFAVRSSGEVIVKNGGSLSITDAAIRSDITVNDSSMNFGSGNLYGETGRTATIALSDSSLNVGNKIVLGKSSDLTRKGALVLDNATVTGAIIDVTAAGSVSASKGTTIDVTGTINNAGAISIVADGTTLKAGAIANAATGSITIDATGYQAGTIVKVIDLNQDKKLDKVTVDVGDTGAKVVYGNDGDVYLHDKNVDKVYVKTSWGENVKIGDAVETSDGTTAYFGINAFTSMLDAMDTKAATIQLESDITESLSYDYEFIIDKNTKITAASSATAANKYVVKFVPTGSWDIVFGSDDGKKSLTIDSNVEFGIDNRLIWTGYYGNKNLTLYVDGTLRGGYQIWNGSTTIVSETGKLISGGEAFVIRRGKTITINGSAEKDTPASARDKQLEVNYCSLLSGTIDAHNTYIYGGQIGISNYPNYSYEGPVNLYLDNTIWQSTGFIKATTTTTGTTDHGSVLIELVNGSTISAGDNGSVFDANTVVNVKSGSLFSLKTVTNSGEVTIDGGSFSATSLTNSGSFTVSGVSTLDIATLTGNAIEVAAGSTLKDSTVGGTLALNRGVTKFIGANSVNDFSPVNYFDEETAGKVIATVEAGNSLKINRMTLGYGLAFDITGSIENALTAEKPEVASFETTGGFSFNGFGTGTFTANNAYVKFGGTTSPKQSSATGDYEVSFTKSIVDVNGAYKMYTTTNDVTITTTFDGSVLNHTGHLTNENVNATMTFQNGSVATVNSSFKNGGVFQVLSGSKFTANAISTNKAPYVISENAGNYGSITVDGVGSEMALNIQDYFYSGSIIEGQPATITVTKGGKFSFTGKPLVNAGAITIDTASLLVGTELINTETGTITIDAEKLAKDSYVKVIDLNQASALTGVSVVGNSNARAIYGADGDVVVTNITANKLYVNSAWTGINPATEKAYEFGDEIVLAPGSTVYYGINAFSNFTDAYYAAEDNGTIMIYSDLDGTGLPNLGNYYTKNLTFVGAGEKGARYNITLNNPLQIEATWTVGGLDDEDKPIATNIGFAAGDWTNGLNIRSNTGKLVVTDGATADLGYLYDRGTIEVNKGATLKAYYGLLPGTKSGDGDPSVLTINDAQLVFDSNSYNLEGHFGNSAPDKGVINVVLTNGKITALDTVTPGLVFDSTATLTATGTSEITAATKIENKGELNLSSTKLTAGTTITNTGTINAYADSTISATGLFTNDNEVVLVGTKLTANGIVNNASFKATDSVIDGGGQAGSPHITNGLGGTMELTNSTITTGAFIINSYGTSISLDKSTLDARIINSKEITAVDSTIISTDLRNEGGKFVVSGDSSLKVKLTNGTIDLENATLTATTVTGDGNLSIAAKYVKTPAVPAQGVEGEEGYVAGSDAVLGDNVVTFKGANTVNAITNNGTLALVGIPGTPAVPAQGVEGEEGYVPAQAAIPAEGAFTAGAIINNGTITIDNLSSISATSIAGGTIELTNFADNATRPVITVNGDFTADVVWTYGEKEYKLAGYTTYTDDRKYLVQKSVTGTATTISVVNVSSGLETLVVNSDWSTKSAGDVVTVGEKDYIIGYNAFSNVDSVFALYGDKDHRNTVTEEVVFLSDVTATATGKQYFFSDIDVAFTAASDVTVDLTKYSRAYMMGYYEIENFVGSPTTVPTFTVGEHVTFVVNNLMAGQNIDNPDDVDAQGNPTRAPGAAKIIVDGVVKADQTYAATFSDITISQKGKQEAFGTNDTKARALGTIHVIGDGTKTEVQYAAPYVDMQNGKMYLNDTFARIGNFWLSDQSANDAGFTPDRLGQNSTVIADNTKIYADPLKLMYADALLTLQNGSELSKDGTNGLEVTNKGTIEILSGSSILATTVTNEGTITLTATPAVGTEGEEGYKPAVASQLTATGIITNNGEFSATGSTILAKATGFGFVNNETLTIDSSTVTVGGGAAILKNEGSGAKQITIKNDSTVNAGLYNYTGATVTITESTVGTKGAYVKNWGTIDATDAVLKASYVENYGTYTVGGESSFEIGSLSVGSITLADDAEISASTITESAEGTSVKVLADTEVTFVGTNSINAVIDNAGSLSADDLQVKKLINGIAATESTESVKGTITAATLTADSIVNNNGAGTNSGSSIELTGDLEAGDITNGVEAIADEAANNAEPDNKAFITAANITADSITNFGTIGSQDPTKTSIEEITLDGDLNNGKYGNVFATILTAASIENDGEIVVNEIYAGSINNKASGENKPCGVIAVDNGSIVIDADEIINSGYINTNGGSIKAGAITNNAYNAETNDGLIWTDSITADGTVINYGKIDVDGTLTANRVENKGGEFTVNGESVIAGNVVVSGGKVTFNDNVTAANLNTQNASATININNATVSVAGTIYYSGTIVATDSFLDGSKFSGTGTMKVVNSPINGITLNHGTMQLDTMSLADVTIDGAFDVVGDSKFSGVNEVEGLTVSEGATLTISAKATITSLTQPALTVSAGNLVNNGTITIDADGLEWGSTLKQLKVVSVTGAERKVINSGTITVENADNTMAIVQDDGIYLYYVKSSGDTKTLFVNEAWNYAPGYEWDYDAEHHLVFGVNAFQNANDIVFYTNTEALVFVGGNTTSYADLVWNKDDVSVTIDGGLTANFSNITLGAATLTGDITANAVTFTGDAVLNGTADVAALNIKKTLAMDWINPIEADTLTAAPASITIDLSHDLETVGKDTAVIATDDWSVAQFESAVADYDKNADIFKVVDGDLKLNAAAIGKVFSTSKEGDGYFTTVAAAVADGDTKRILIASNDLVDGKVENVYLKSKRGVVLSSAGQISRSVFAGGYDVSTLDGVKKRPFSDNYKHVGEEGEGAEESTNVTINGGTYNGYVIGADMILLDTAVKEETNVLFYRTGDSNLTINAGDFKASANGVRAIAGGMMYAISGSGKTGRAGLVGDVNLTITGGTFYGFNVYGGNYANNNKNYGTFTSIEGNITVTLDASKQKLVFEKNSQATGIITAGSYGPSSVDGSTKVVLTGSNGIEFQQLIGGCSGDIYSKDTKTDKWVNESMVTGSRTLSFTGFSGDLDFAKIHGFNTVSFEGANEINFDGGFHRYFNDEVTNWNFAADSEVTGSLSFDFLGDALNLDDFTTGGWELSNVSMDAATTVSFDGELADGNIEDGWTNAAGTLALSFDSEANKLSLASINIG